jgi:hypothetical protein
MSKQGWFFMNTWLDDELSLCPFKDHRLKKRFASVIETLNNHNGQSIPQAFEAWSATKATYRFLSNERIEESEILQGHFSQTYKRIAAHTGPVLVLHDTTACTYHRKNPEAIGYTRKSKLLKHRADMPSEYKVCGVLMHASLAVTSEGLPLGLAAVCFWSRKVFKNTCQLKRHIQPTRIPIEKKESIKWLKNLGSATKGAGINALQLIHISDRERDIYEYMSDCIMK